MLQMTTELVEHFDRIVGPGRWEFIFVENGSADATPKILADIVKRWPRTRVLTRPRPDYGGAMRAGVLASAAPWVHIIDIEQWDMVFFNWAWRNRDHYDVILGSKLADPVINQQSGYRQFLSWVLNSLLRLAFKFNGSDTHGPKLLKMDTIRPVAEASTMIRGHYDTELVLRALRGGLWVAEGPTAYVEYRPTRTLMLRKITETFIDQYRMYKKLAAVPFSGPIRYHRFAREDLELARPAHARDDT